VIKNSLQGGGYEKKRGWWLSLKNKWHRIRVSFDIAKMQTRAYGKPIIVSKKEVDDYSFSDAEEKRISYYLGDIGKQKAVLQINDRSLSEVQGCWKPAHKLLAVTYYDVLERARTKSMMPGNALPIINVFNLLSDTDKKIKFLLLQGDNIEISPLKGVISKTRVKGDSNITLLKLKPRRHWNHLHQIAKLDRTFMQKKDMGVWRGASTGRKRTIGKRSVLVSRLFDKTKSFDVGYSKIVRNQAHLEPYVKGFKTIKEQLQYKVLISLEGNDVASGLKWMLLSNSVVMMPKPTICSWAMEGLLEPFVHYIPLMDDFSDVEEQMDWAIKHAGECMGISKNATDFMSQFLDPHKETMLECEVMRRYLDNMHVF
jgi:hypothetical protein